MNKNTKRYKFIFGAVLIAGPSVIAATLLKTWALPPTWFLIVGVALFGGLMTMRFAGVKAPGTESSEK